MLGGHINPAVTFGLFLARKVSLVRAALYMVAQCLGAICGVGLAKAFQSSYYNRYKGGANMLSDGYSKGTGLGAEIIGTFVLVYTVFSATDPKRKARDSHVPVRYVPKNRNFWLFHLYFILFVDSGVNCTFFCIGVGTTSNWVCGVHGSPGHHPYHRHRHQPC